MARVEGFERTHEGELMDEGLRGFIHELSELTGEYIPVEYLDGTYEIEADSFTLTFTVDDTLFEIRSIDVHGNTGTGRKVITAVHAFADEHRLEVIASNVRDTAHGFWEKMGYQEGDSEEEFYRVA